MSDCILTVTASPEDSGTRLDAFIGYNTDELSRSYAVKLIEKGRVKVNGNTVTSKKLTVSEGDTITIDMPEPDAEGRNMNSATTSAPTAIMQRAKAISRGPAFRTLRRVLPSPPV